jgi:hypothetical protein
MKKSLFVTNVSLTAKIILLTSFVVFTSHLFAQKKVTEQDLVWYSLASTFNINENWYFQNELHQRHFVNPTAQHQSLIRAHIHRKLGQSGWEISAGACYFLQSPQDPRAKVRLTVPELRPHIEFAYKQKNLEYLTLDHRYRAEARYYHNTNDVRTELEDGYHFENYRLRYRLQATIPFYKINEQQSLRLRFNDEVMINVGSNIVTNVYDQNRLYGGISYVIMPQLEVEAGYFNWFQQNANGRFVNRNIARFNLTTNF